MYADIMVNECNYEIIPKCKCPEHIIKVILECNLHRHSSLRETVIVTIK